MQLTLVLHFQLRFITEIPSQSVPLANNCTALLYIRKDLVVENNENWFVSCISDLLIRLILL